MYIYLYIYIYDFGLKAMIFRFSLCFQYIYKNMYVILYRNYLPENVIFMALSLLFSKIWNFLYSGIKQIWVVHELIVDKIVYCP